VEVKHKGLVNMYFLNRVKPELSSDPAGTMPNDRFWKQEREAH
jgi:adenylate cyclase